MWELGRRFRLLNYISTLVYETSSVTLIEIISIFLIPFMFDMTNACIYGFVCFMYALTYTYAFNITIVPQ